MSLLQLWRAWSIKYLKEKARITFGGGAIDGRLVHNPKSRFLPHHPAIFRVQALLFGCVDETATLQGHFYDTPKRPPNASISGAALLFECVDETATLLDHFPISTLPPQMEKRLRLQAQTQLASSSSTRIVPSSTKSTQRSSQLHSTVLLQKSLSYQPPLSRLGPSFLKLYHTMDIVDV